MPPSSRLLAKPRLRVVPRGNDFRLGEAAVALAAGYGLVADDWQADWVNCTLCRKPDGRWAASISALMVARQNGKNGGIEIIELFGMVALGLKFLHTAHEVKTARKAFRRIASFFENERQHPELAALVVEIRKTNGQEAIVLRNGGSIEFIARSSGSGRGFTVDVLVCDEVQELTDDELAALLPTISAAPSGNPLVVLTGTPPDPEKPSAKGEVIRRVRADAQAGRDKTVCFVDFGVPDGPLPDVDNRAVWQETNPALGGRLNIAEVVRERSMMSAEVFARERLGWWGDPAADRSSAFGPGRWDACRVDELAPVVGAVGAAVAWDRRHASITVAGLDGDVMVVGVVERREGTGWLVPELKRIQSERGCPVAVDGHGPTADLIPALEAAGVTLTILKTTEAFDAVVSLFDRVQAETLAHPGHPDLDGAVAVTVKRETERGFAWGRKKSEGDISMLEAATWAAWCADNAPNYNPLNSVL